MAQLSQIEAYLSLKNVWLPPVFFCLVPVVHAKISFSPIVTKRTDTFEAKSTVYDIVLGQCHHFVMSL